MKKLFEYIVLFIYGGVIYYFLELLYRGYSHYAMILVGGLCFLCIGLLNKRWSYKVSLIKQMTKSSLIITAIEFFAGVILNMWLNLNIWDYSKLKFNLYGQVSLQTSILWFFVSLPAIYLYNNLRHWMFKEEKTKYKFL